MNKKNLERPLKVLCTCSYVLCLGRISAFLTGQYMTNINYKTVILILRNITKLTTSTLKRYQFRLHAVFIMDVEHVES